MKNSAYLINISRSEIVNMQDLYEALKNDKIKGAALDIRTCQFVNPNCAKLSEEMKLSLECYEETRIVNELANLSNVIITPHIAYKTADVMEYIFKTSIKGILDCVKGGTAFRAC